MTQTSKLFQRGEFFVTVVTLKDADQISEGGERKAFAVMHEPTGVQVAIMSMPPVAIRVCAQLDKQLEEVRKDPLGDSDDSPPPNGFGGFPV